jgi:hypothetical protein
VYSDREGGLCDVALLNRLNGNILKEGETDDCEDGGGGESSEIHVGSDCSGDAEGSDILACRCYVLLSDSDCMKDSSE